jgi:5,10-methylenetetrahydromethanopterin reductase
MAFGMSWQGREFAATAEQAGIDAFCTGDFVDHDAYVSLTEMALSTQQCRVGTAIAYAFGRTPFAHAAALRQLSTLAPGRVFMGLGTGAFSINRDWFGVAAERPMARIAEVVQVVRAYLEAENGETISFDGEFYRISARVGAPVLGRVDVPILLAAFNAGMARTAGRVADGVIGHGLFTTTWWDEVVRPAVATGAAHCDRGTTPEEYGWVITAVDDDDPERARRDTRRMIAFYLTVATYDSMVERHGWQRQTEALRAAFKAGDIVAMETAVDDPMLEAIAVCGTTAEAEQQWRARGAGVPADLAFLAPPSYYVSPRRRRAYATSALGLIRRITV